MTNSDEQYLGTFKRKVLRRIFDSLREGTPPRIRWNGKLYELFGDVDTVTKLFAAAASYGLLRYTRRVQGSLQYKFVNYGALCKSLLFRSAHYHTYFIIYYYYNLWNCVQGAPPVAGVPTVSFTLLWNCVLGAPPVAGVPTVSFTLLWNYVSEAPPVAGVPTVSFTLSGTAFKERHPLLAF